MSSLFGSNFGYTNEQKLPYLFEIKLLQMLREGHEVDPDKVLDLCLPLKETHKFDAFPKRVQEKIDKLLSVPAVAAQAKLRLAPCALFTPPKPGYTARRP
ncbi:MAG: hypothetical protein LRY67_06460 [Gammaproteobacteria bacterium]|nr:hypothetical protein [Gammaproteobacteria bacterium]MCD8542966.1 hypothetical protein [Gammaproteobacteria bacterium]